MRGELYKWQRRPGFWRDGTPKQDRVLVSTDAELCGKTLECGGVCDLAPEHEGPCSCGGDEREPGDCPA